ncbi:uncharacterized protein VP01_2001g3 [Puccinia sorghi]|uniref:Retrotransposon gag domain-containing protein n=1 Tax=Puccinia sorghi TaxID=27349 RepID=A0A0L6VBD9_9BASI|nr:uncharacterized protein VP01_2001g3 [Puccinia sorghi]
MGTVVPLPRVLPTVFAVLFMKDYVETWSQPYLGKVFNGEPVVFNKFINDFRASFFDHNRRHRAEPQGEHPTFRAMVLKEGQTIEGIRQGHPIPSTRTSTPTPNPNAMDLSAFQKAPSNQLSDTKHACRVQLNLCFHCGQAGHISCGFLNGGRNQLSPRQPQQQ